MTCYAKRSYWIPGSYETSSSRSAPSNALPRLRTLCTNSKKPRYSGSFSCAMPRCGRSQLRHSDQSQSMDGSLRPPLLQNPACALSTHEAPQPYARCHQHPSGSYTTSRACDLRFDAFPSRGIAPSRHSVGLALLQRYSLRSRAHDRPHVSLSEALLSAFASCGIPPDTPCGWYLLPLR